MTKRKTLRLLSHRVRRPSGDAREMAERLAPLEELLPPDSKKKAVRLDESEVVAQENGAIVVGRHMPALPEDVIEGSSSKGLFGIEPVVIIIVGMLLAFTVFIAWQVSQMPAPPVNN